MIRSHLREQSKISSGVILRLRIPLFLLIGCFLSVSALRSQTSGLDSLIQRLSETPADTSRVSLYHRISYQLLNVDLAQADSFVQEGLRLAETLDNDKWMGNMYYIQAAVLHRQGNGSEGVKIAHQARLIFTEIKEEHPDHLDKLTSVYNLLSTIHLFTGQPDSGLHYGIKSLELAREAKDSVNIAIALFSVGNLHEAQEQNAKAKQYYKEAEVIMRPRNIPRILGPILYGLGSMSEGEERLQYLGEAISLFEEIGHLSGIATAKTAIGVYYVVERDRPDLALAPYTEALEIFEQIGATYGAASAKTSLSHIWISLENAEAARAILDSTLALARSKNYVKMIPDLFKQKARLAVLDQNLEEADRWMDSLDASKEAIFDEAQAKLQTDADAQYQTSKKEAELAQQELELERERTARSTQLIAALLLIGLLTGIFLFIRLRLRRRQQEAELMAELERNESQKLRELDEMKSNFFTNVSHEFRTPLTLLLGPLRQMQEGNFTGDLPSYLRMMTRNGERLENLIDQLLDLARLESGKMDVQLRSGDLLDFLRIQVSSFESWAVRKDISFEMRYPSEAIPAAFDPDKLSKILNNLLSNAFKYTPEEGRVTFEASHDDRQLLMRISDTGYGIPEDVLPHIFDRFTTGDQTQDGLASSGIGLALTKELIELMEGKIEVDSEMQAGTTFTLSFPLLPESAASTLWRPLASLHASTDELGQSAVSLTSTDPSLVEQPLLLIAEDNADLRTYIADQFRDRYQILLAEDGQVGLDTAQERVPDLIITDVMMPNIDGTELTRQLKTDQRTSHIPIIMLTAKAEQADKLAGLETGADDYLTKPFDAAELKVRAANLIEQRRRLRERFGREGGIQLKEIAVTSTDQQFLDRLIACIEEHISDESLSIVELSEHMHLSRSQLHRKLKALTDKSPSVFLRTIRLHRAKDLLQKGAGNVSDICYQVGFSSVAYFSKTFKEEFGQSPSEIKSTS